MIPSNPHIHDIDEDDQYLLSQFRYPDNIALLDYLTDYEMGGIATQDPTQGLNYQPWKGYWNRADNTAYIHPLDSTAPHLPIFTESDVEDFTFTFDQNMRWTAAIRKADNTVKFYWYDSALESYVITPYSGMTSIKLAHDDHRDSQVSDGVTDIIFTYLTTGGTLKWRIQRDRYLTEYTHSGTTFPQTAMITHFGLSTAGRLQWRIGPRRIQT